MEHAPLSPMSDDDDVRRQQSMKHRQVSVYAARSGLGMTEVVPGQNQVPAMPDTPISPRWDSLSNGGHIRALSPTAMTSPIQDALIISQVPPLPPSFSDSDLGSLHRSSNTSVLTDGFPDVSPRLPLHSKDSQSDMRSEAGSVENFSRPRKPSNKQQVLEAGSTHSVNMVPPELVEVLPQPAPWQRSRGPSVSSFRSALSISTLGSPVSADGDGRLQRPWASPPGIGSALAGPLPSRPSPTNSRIESAHSAPAGASSGAPWMNADEPRSSLRSQLTVSSTTPEMTERSSVMTKDSSVSSMYAHMEADTEEPSIEDVMGMYEKGFKDDTDDSDSDSEENNQSRPATAISETAPVRRPIEVASDMGSVPTIPDVTPKQLDAEIRQSKLIFSNPDFMATLPALADLNEDILPSVREVDDSDSFTKRDSAKSTASDPIASQRLPQMHRQMSTPAGVPSTVLPSSPLSSAPVTTTAPGPSPMQMPPTPAPTSAPRPEFEDPGSRDRYGFKKENQYVTREQYDEWNKGYSQYLSRRRRKWVQYLKDSALMTDRPIRFPSPNAKTKRFVRKGIPPDWRGAAWFYYAGGPAILGKNSGLYVKLLQKPAKQVDVEAIERDLHRTFPDNIQFKYTGNVQPGTSTSQPGSERHSQSTLTGGHSSDDPDVGPKPVPGEPPIITSLRRVLHAFSVYNPRIGYCQSLNFLAGMLLLFVETEENCFWLLNVITHIYLPGTHEMSLEGSKVDLGVLMTEIRDTMPEVWDKIGGELEGELSASGKPTASKPTPSRSIRLPLGRPRHRSNQSVSTERLPPITLCMTAWFMSCYIGTLPIETVLRVWDVFFYEGSKTLFRVAMAVFKQGEQEIRAVSDPMEMFGVVQTMPRKMLDVNGLMELCFKRRNGFNHLNQEVIDGRRRERRDKARKERADAQGAKSNASGSVTDVEPEAAPLPRRRATLFGGRKKREPSRQRAVEA